MNICIYIQYTHIQKYIICICIYIYCKWINIYVHIVLNKILQLAWATVDSMIKPPSMDSLRCYLQYPMDPNTS